MDRTRLARHLVRSALAYHEAELWQRFHSNDLIAVHVPGHAHPVFVSIMGPGGDHGLCAFRGPSALRSAAWWTSAPGTEEAASAADLVAVSFNPVSIMPDEFQALLREAKFSGSVAPHCMAKPPGRLSRPSNRSENELLLWLLEGLLAADRKDLLRPIEPNLDQATAVIWTLRLSGKAQAPEVRAQFEEHALARGPAAMAPAAVALPDDVRELPRTDASWWLATPLLHRGIEGDDRELKAVMVFDETAERLLAMHAVLEVDPAEVADVLFRACRDDYRTGTPGLPARLAVDRQDLHDVLQPVLAAASVDVELVPEIAVARQLLADFQESQLRGEGAEDLDALADDWPDDDDLHGWKRIDAQVSALFTERVARDDAAVRKATRRYFGQDRGFLEADGEMALACFAEWFACTAPPSAGAPTPADRMRADESLAPAVRQVIAERAGARIELYRVRSVTSGEGVELELVKDGRRVRVTDRSMSAVARAGIVLFAKVYPVGAFRFVAALSAPLRDVDRTLTWLEERGFELEGEELSDTAHVLGRLWSLRAWTAGDGPRIVNTDGDAVVDVRVGFAVRDPDALRRALVQREDVEASDEDEDEDEDQADSRMVWLGSDRGIRGRTILGELQFIGGELVASVNSEQRLQRLLRWLPGMPGIGKQLAVTRREFPGAPADGRPGAGNAQAPPPEELAAALREHLREHYRRWLDEPLPVLGGKTPRQAARTAAGRKKVARLIRTTPDPEGPAGPLFGAVPRAEMLRELGLEDEASGTV